MEKRIFRFSGSTCDWASKDAKHTKMTLGGKGQGLVAMAQAGLPVPPGFTITTAACNEYRKLDAVGKVAFMDVLLMEVFQSMEWLTKEFGYRPLVSVRSGAPISMPGMMDTILNVGLTDTTLAEWGVRLGDNDAAYRTVLDCQRRLIQMLGHTAYGVPMEVFEFQLAKVKKASKVTEDKELGLPGLATVVSEYTLAFKANKGFDFPSNEWKIQLHAAIVAVFESWMNPRAIEYRKLNKIDEAMGTAVTVQAMVFGNMGETSGSGVLFSRNPSTGEKVIMAEYLSNAQGEDVVAGIRTPEKLELTDTTQYSAGSWKDSLACMVIKLEKMYNDMVDVEFTVQDGKLFILQSRSGKRSAMAAFKIATDQVASGEIDRKTAISRLNAEQFKVLRRPGIDPKFTTKANLVGLPACPGVVSGVPVFSSEDAVASKVPCILITHETTPDDIAGMAKCTGILTQTGGATSHAAVVARAMDKTCITGCTAMDLTKMAKAKKVTIDGSTGNVWIDVDVPVIDTSDAPAVQTVMGWCMEALGACEIAPVDLGEFKAHRIVSAYWWGSLDVLDAVLDGLAELPSRAHIVLDVNAPVTFTPSADQTLAHCFGDGLLTDTFKSDMTKRLVTRKDALKGLQIAPYSNMNGGGVLTAAYPPVAEGLQTFPKAVPPDYATFVVLGR